MNRLLCPVASMIVAILVCGCSARPALYPAPIDLAIVNGTLIDGTGADPVSDAVVLVGAGCVVGAGPSGSLAVPGGVRIVDAEGCTVLPGFINAHVHRAYNASNLRAWAAGGVTTVRDLGADPDDPLFAIRNQLSQDPANARLVAAGPLVTAPNGYPMIPFGSRSGLPVTSPSAAVAAVTDLLGDGADLIKVAVESGAVFNMSIPTLSPEGLAAIVQAAHDGGTVVSAHVLVSEDLERALDAGADDIAHMVCDDLPQSLIERMVAEEVYQVPTLELWHNVGYGLDRVAVENLGRFVRAGGLVALGTDYAGYSGTFDLGMPVREIELMQDAGMTVMQIIVAATRNAARVCNLGHQLGTLEAGKIADVIVVDGNPLEDASALQDVSIVIREGSIIRGG